MLRIQLSLFAILLSALGTIALSDALAADNVDPLVGMLAGGAVAGIGITVLFMVERFRGIVAPLLIPASTVVGYTSYHITQTTPGTESTATVLIVGLISMLAGALIALLSWYVAAEE